MSIENSGPSAERETRIEDAERILGKDVFGPEDIEWVFGARVDRVPPIPFTRKELEQAKALGQQLILYTDRLAITEPGSLLRDRKRSIVPITMENMEKGISKEYKDNPLLNSGLYNNEAFFKSEKPRVGWRLTSKEVIWNSPSKNYLDQTDILVEYVKTEAFKGMPLPKEYVDAIDEYTKKRAAIATLMENDDWRGASQELAALKITKLTRETPVEVTYRLAVNSRTLRTKDAKPLRGMYTWTSERDSGGRLVLVGHFGDDGARVDLLAPRGADDNLGVCFSRS